MYFVFIIVVVILAVTIYLVSDYIGPERIKLKPSIAFGIDCLRAKDLIVQEFDSNGHLWATRGFIIYCLRKGEREFVKVSRVPSGSSVFWLNNYRIFRKFTLRSECVEMTVSEEGKITAFSSGIIWFSAGPGQKFQKEKELDHFGLHIGRGIMSTGLLQANKRELFLGEYFSNKERTNVRVLRLNNELEPGRLHMNSNPGRFVTFMHCKEIRLPEGYGYVSATKIVSP